MNIFIIIFKLMALIMCLLSILDGVINIKNRSFKFKMYFLFFIFQSVTELAYYEEMELYLSKPIGLSQSTLDFRLNNIKMVLFLTFAFSLIYLLFQSIKAYKKINEFENK